MKIQLNQDPAFTETEIIINCPHADEDILRLIASLRVSEQKITGELDGELRLLDIKDVLYIDTADKRTFLYTEKQVYKSTLRLYELEERLAGMDFSGRANPVSSISAASEVFARNSAAACCLPWKTGRSSMCRASTRWN